MSIIESNEVEYCQIKVKYSSDSQIVKDKRAEALKELRKKPISGFRPGKATDQAILQKHSLRVNDWTKRELLKIAADDILFETKLRPIGMPQTLSAELNGSNFSCELLFLKKPDFELKSIKDLEIPKPHETISSADLTEKMLEDLRTRNGENKPFSENDYVENNDTITMDYKTGTECIDGSLYNVGSNVYPDLDDNIIGMAAGETRSFESNGNNCEVTVHMGMKKIPCALDDELAQKVGLKTLEELRTAVNNMAGNQCKQMQTQQISQQVIAKLVDMHDFQVPDFLITMETQQLIAAAKLKPEDVSDDLREAYKGQAIKNVKFALILDSVRVENPECELSDSEIIGIVKQNLIQNGNTNPNALIVEMQKNGRLLGLGAQIRNQAALEWIVKNVKLVE
jgi:trigger factor